MKTFFTLFAGIFLMSSSLFAQEIKKIEPKMFWETNIQSILDGDVEKVVRESHFPMTTFEGDWSEEDFVDAFDILFDESTLASLNIQTYRQVQVFKEGDGLATYMVVIATETESDGEVYESVTMLSFKKFDGKWKLCEIDMAG